MNWKKISLILVILAIFLILGIYLISQNSKSSNKEIIQKEENNLNKEKKEEIKESPQENSNLSDEKVSEEDTQELKENEEIIPQNYKLLTITKAKKLYDETPDLIIIDVSIEKKFKEGHIKGAINYPLDKLEEISKALDKEKVYLVYGRSDAESRNAAKKLANLGFKNVNTMRGSYGLWVQMGYPIEK